MFLIQGITTPNPVPKSLVRFNPCLYLFGGIGKDGAFLNDLYSFNLISRIWSKIEPRGTLPAPRESHTAQLWSYGGKELMVVYAGFERHGSRGEESTFCDNIVVYDIGISY